MWRTGGRSSRKKKQARNVVGGAWREVCRVELSWVGRGWRNLSTSVSLSAFRHPLSPPLVSVPTLAQAYRNFLCQLLGLTFQMHRLLRVQDIVVFWKFGSWQRARAISFLYGKYRITVNYIEKLDSFTAVIIYLPICLRELAAGEKIKCNLGKKKSLLIHVWRGASLLSEFTLHQSDGFL